MDVSISISFFKKPLDWVSEKLFMKAYKVSHYHYLDRIRLGAHWEDLGEHLEYSISLLSIFSNDRVPTSKIAIRAKEGKKFKKICIRIEAKTPNTVNQNSITIYDLGSEIVIKTLQDIPLRNVFFSGNRIYTSYSDVQIKVTEMIRTTGEDELKNKEIIIQFHPTDTEFLNSEFVERWGSFWNVDEINWIKRNIKQYLNMKILFSYDLHRRRGLFFFLRNILFWILTNKVSLSIAFWSKNRVHAKGIIREIEQNTPKD